MCLASQILLRILTCKVCKMPILIVGQKWRQSGWSGDKNTTSPKPIEVFSSETLDFASTPSTPSTPSAPSNFNLSYP